MNDGKRTVDGIPVKVGDPVWFADVHGVRRRKLHKTDLGTWWTTMTIGRIYSTERAALEAKLASEKKDLRKAQQEIRRAAKAIARLKSRLADVTTRSAL